MSRPRFVALLLALITLVVYLPATHHEFLTYDDDEYVVSNVAVQNGPTPAGVEWAFTTFHAGNWHPLTWLSHMADCGFFGLNPAAHHFVNVLLHAVNTALLFILLVRLVKKIVPATIVAALFAWHPLHVESVAWVAERKDVLSTFFALLALLSYTRFVQKPEAGSRKSEAARTGALISDLRPPASGLYWLALFFFALGLLAKPMVVTLPFVLLLLDYWPLKRISDFRFQISDLKKLVVEKIPFFLLSAASCVITFIAQHAGNAVSSLDEISLGFRLENSSVAVVRYLLKIFWPADLAVIYPLAPIPVATVALAVTTLLGISLAVWFARKSNPCWLVGWLWFLGTLVPVIGLVQVGVTCMADRYTYIPSVGVFIAVVFGLNELAGRRPWSQKTYLFCMALILTACAMLTERQLRYWRDSETLFRHTIAVTRHNFIAHLNLGVALDLQGRTPEALTEFCTAVTINPEDYKIHYSIGNMLDKLGQPGKALTEYRLCLSHKPNVPALHNAVGGCLVALGNLDGALAEFAEAARLDPHYAPPHVGTAKALLLQGRDPEAIKELREALRIEPDNFQILAYTAHILAANENATARDGRNALAFARKANDLSGSNQPMVLDILGMACAETGDFTNAVTCAQNAAELADQAKLKSLEAIRHRLELYRNQQPWRESFRATNGPPEN